jgi:hypothetical protein
VLVYRAADGGARRESAGVAEVTIPRQSRGLSNCEPLKAA